MQKVKQQALKQVARLLATITRIIREEGVCISSERNEIFRSVLNKEDRKLEEGMPMWLLWQQQIKQTSSNPKVIRWQKSVSDHYSVDFLVKRRVFKLGSLFRVSTLL